jgi:opacity protein-like surface antigen
MKKILAISAALALAILSAAAVNWVERPEEAVMQVAYGMDYDVE